MLFFNYKLPNELLLLNNYPNFSISNFILFASFLSYSLLKLSYRFLPYRPSLNYYFCL